MQNSPSTEFSASGYTIDSFEASLWAFLNGENAEDCLLKVINLGNDADTTAVITAGLAGTYYFHCSRADKLPLSTEVKAHLVRIKKFILPMFFAD